MADILGHPWMRGETLTDEQFQGKCKAFMELAIEEKKKANTELGIDHCVEKIRRGEEDFEGMDFVTRLFRAPPEEHTVDSSNKFKKLVIEHERPIEVMQLLY